MNSASTIGKARFAGIASLAMLTSFAVLAQQPERVYVLNDPRHPVPIFGTVTVNPAPSPERPVQWQRDIKDSASCAPRCTLEFFRVPEGKRMVLTNVSAFVGADQEAVVIEGNGVFFFVPKPYPASHVLAAPVTVHFNAGHTPTVSIHIQDSSQHTPLIVTLVGYVVPDR